MQAKLKIFFIFLVYFSLSSAVFPALAAEKKHSAGKVATVNGSIITQRDFDRDFNQAQQMFLRSGKHLSDSELTTFREKILQELINRELLYQDSLRKGIVIDEAQVDERLEELKKRFPSEEEFKTSLKDMDLSEAGFRSVMKRGIILEKFIDTQFAQKTTISEEESNKFYKENPDVFKKPEQVKASHILIKVDPEADDSEKTKAHKKLEKIQKKLEKGEDFAELAKEFSQGPSSTEGGDLGYFSRGQMVKPFEDAAFSLKSGDVSNIVTTRFGYHLIKVVDKKPETTVPYQEVKDNLDNFLKRKKVQEKISAHISQLEKKAKIEKFLPKNP
jgi:peptidyl-prolyl cis-trans isomerase C